MKGSVVNGERVRETVLSPGDQIVFDAYHRFVVEAPSRAATAAEPSVPNRQIADPDQVRGSAGSGWRLPWLLLAAALLAMALAALFWFGAK